MLFLSGVPFRFQSRKRRGRGIPDFSQAIHILFSSDSHFFLKRKKSGLPEVLRKGLFVREFHVVPLYHSFQNTGLNRMSTLNSSRRPMSIRNDTIHCAASGMPLIV